ncbi:MAG: methyltransferase domain-containing protein [Chloroflexi bacterium]|nr:methyltransferase domain-containing protein [Chloroflexota bacterium]
MDHDKTIRDFYDMEYSKLQHYHLENWRLSYLERVFRRLDLGNTDPDRDRLLDIGVGGCGFTVIEAAKRGLKATGIDLSGVAVSKADSFAHSYLDDDSRQRCEFIACSAEMLPFADGSFSKVCSISVLEYISNDIKAMDEMARITRKGGRIFICVTNGGFFLSKINDLLYDRRKMRRYRAEHLIEMYRRRGFVVVDLTFHAHLVKVLQYGLQALFPSLRDAKSSLWWSLEKSDLRNSSSRSAMFSITLEKVGI